VSGASLRKRKRREKRLRSKRKLKERWQRELKWEMITQTLILRIFWMWMKTDKNWLRSLLSFHKTPTLRYNLQQRI
jgi:hypothetical protein